jgi:phosphomannomutase
MQRENAVIGGEGNGGVIYPRINFARDSLVGIALILHCLAETQQSVTQLMQRFPRFSMIKDKLPCPSERIPMILKTLRRNYAKYPMDTRDGVKVTLPNGWFLVRGSNTEPIVRVVAEAKSEIEARSILEGIYAMAQSISILQQ